MRRLALNERLCPERDACTALCDLHTISTPLCTSNIRACSGVPKVRLRGVTRGSQGIQKGAVRLSGGLEEIVCASHQTWGLPSPLFQNPGPCSRHSGLTSGLEHDSPGRQHSVVTNRGLWPQFLYLVKVKVLPAQSCPTPFNPTDCIARQAPLSVGMLQARILEWVASPFSRGSSRLRDQSRVSCTAGRFFTF